MRDRTVLFLFCVCIRWRNHAHGCKTSIAYFSGIMVKDLKEVREMLNKKWFKAAGIRAVKTMAQSFVAMIGTAAVMQDVNWVMVGSATVLSGILSLATSVAGLPEVE